MITGRVSLRSYGGLRRAMKMIFHCLLNSKAEVLRSQLTRVWRHHLTVNIPSLLMNVFLWSIGQIQSSAIYKVRSWEWTVWSSSAVDQAYYCLHPAPLLTRGQVFAPMLKLRGMFFKSPAWGTWMITLCTMISLHMGWNHMWTVYTRKCVSMYSGILCTAYSCL